MYICIHNQSNSILSYTTYSRYIQLHGKQSKYLDIDGCNRIIFYFEKGCVVDKYQRYYRELSTDDIKSYNLYIFFKCNKVFIKQKDK